MTEQGLASVAIVCCSVLQSEVKELQREHWPETSLSFKNSILHMAPGRLSDQLNQAIDAELSRGRKVALVYGDCCSTMTGFESRPGVARTQVKNCCDLLLGWEEYRRLSHEGVFFLFPEWGRRWKEIFAAGLGPDSKLSAAIMRDIHSRLVYLDTGFTPVPVSELEACSRYCGLPCEVRRVSLDPLRSAIEETLAKLRVGTEA